MPDAETLKLLLEDASKLKLTREKLVGDFVVSAQKDAKALIALGNMLEAKCLEMAEVLSKKLADLDSLSGRCPLMEGARRCDAGYKYRLPEKCNMSDDCPICGLPTKEESQ